MEKTPYELFAENFKQTVNSEKFLNNKLKIFQLQTGGGKSYFQDKEMPLILKSAFPEMVYLFRLSPTNEVAHDGTFENVEELSSEYLLTYTEDPRDDILKLAGRAENSIICVSCTHSYFSTHFDRLIKYAPKSILCIEEAHQFIGCGDEGSIPYVNTFGYHSNYVASTFGLIKRWMEVNPRVIGFTATPTVHHKGDPTMSNSFDVCSELAELETILPSQSWLYQTKEYPYTKHNGKSSVESAVQQSIDVIFEREELLNSLKERDPNINPKVSALYIAGDVRDVWGCPLSDIKDIISDYLLSLGYSETDKMIATIVEDGNGGMRIHDLNGGYEKVNTANELFLRLQDPKDPVRFLVAINRCRSGINVHNLTCEVICRIRDPKEVRTPIPIQIFGRMVRINTGTGDIIRKKYNNNIYDYLKHYPKDYDIDLDVTIDTLLTANNFSIWYPENPKAKRTWKDSLKEFNERYVNSFSEGKKWVENKFERKCDELKYVRPFFECNHELPLNCPYCGSSIEEKLTEWATSGTLDRFFVDPE